MQYNRNAWLVASEVIFQKASELERGPRIQLICCSVLFNMWFIGLQITFYCYKCFYQTLALFTKQLCYNGTCIKREELPSRKTCNCNSNGVGMFSYPLFLTISHPCDIFEDAALSYFFCRCATTWVTVIAI